MVRARTWAFGVLNEQPRQAFQPYKTPSLGRDRFMQEECHQNQDQSEGRFLDLQKYQLESCHVLSIFYLTDGQR